MIISELANKIEKSRSILKYRADVIICLSVVQHIPDKDYYDKFFKLLSKSGAEDVLIQIRYAKRLTFQDQPYKTTKEIGLACHTNDKYINMPGYRIENTSPIDEYRYQYIQYRYDS